MVEKLPIKVNESAKTLALAYFESNGNGYLIGFINSNSCNGIKIFFIEKDLAWLILSM